jgi:hypothetical protein
LVNDKKTTLEKMEIIFPPGLHDSELIRSFRAYIAQFKMAVSVAERDFLPGYNVFSWQRTMTAFYDLEAREWVPMPQEVQQQSTYLLYMKADQLAQCIRDEDGVKNIMRRMRTVCGPKTQIFLMVDGLTAYFRRKTGIRVSAPSFRISCTCIYLCAAVHERRDRARARCPADGGAHAPSLCRYRR